MRLKDILDVGVDAKDLSCAKRKSVLRKALKKKKNNPIAVDSDPIHNHIDVFGPVGSYGDDADQNPMADHRY